MEKDFIPYEQALALKKLGFDEPCFTVYRYGNLYGRGTSINKYYEDGHWGLEKNSNYGGSIEQWVTAPLYQQVFRWFRKKYILLGFIEPANGYEDKSLFAFYICDDEQNIIDDSHSYSKDSSLHFNTYEEAEHACLEKLIELVKQK